MHGDAILRILTATGRGFLHPFSDQVSDDFQTGECGEDMTGSTQARPTTRPPPRLPTRHLSTPPPVGNGPLLTPFTPLRCAQRYREAAIAALDASVTAGDVVIIHNFWKGEEDEKAHAHYYEEARADLARISPLRSRPPHALSPRSPLHRLPSC